MNEIRDIWTDIKNRKYLEAYIIIVAAFLVLIADIFGAISEDALTEVILATLSLIVYLNIKERREYQALVQKDLDIEGLTSFHINREKMPKLETLVRQANSEIAIYAILYQSIVDGHILELISEKAKKGCKVKMLIMASHDENGNENPNIQDIESRRVHTSRFLELIKINTEKLINWRDGLESIQRDLVEIRTYWDNPIATYFLIDQDTQNGSVQVELFLPLVNRFEQPHYVVTKKQNETFFETHRKSFNGIWNKAKVIT